MQRLGIRSAVLSAIIAFMFAVLAAAQTGSIQGTVTDKTGAVILGADVTTTNLATNASRTASSNNTGAYSFTNVPVGHYSIEVKKEGFKAFKVDDIQLTVAQVLGVDAALEPGASLRRSWSKRPICLLWTLKLRS
jgi:hypothetical protein